MAPARSFRTTFSHITASAATLPRSMVSNTTPDAVAEVGGAAVVTAGTGPFDDTSVASRVISRGGRSNLRRRLFTGRSGFRKHTHPHSCDTD